MDDKLKKTALKKPEETHWGKFLLAAIGRGSNIASGGVHWFIALNEVLEKSIKQAVKDIPDKHPLKSTTGSSSGMQTAVKELKDALLNAEKNDIIDFSGLKFDGYIDFSNFIFPADVSFAGTEFSGEVNFKGAVFSGNVNFENTVFKNQVGFKNAHFLGYTNFQRTEFELHAPIFYGAKFNNDMIWTGIKLPKFKKANSEETDKQYDERVEDNQNAYEHLAIKLDNQKKYHDQHFFFRQEMQCRKVLAENCFTRWAYGAYQLFSNYGYGVGRALGFWAGHIVIFSAILMFLINDCWGWGYSEMWKNLSCSISTSLSNAVPYAFTGFEKDNLMACKNNLAGVDIIVLNTIKTIQTIFGIIFLFLVLLTLRIRFRLK